MRSLVKLRFVILVWTSTEALISGTGMGLSEAGGYFSHFPAPLEYSTPGLRASHAPLAISEGVIRGTGRVVATNFARKGLR